MIQELFGGNNVGIIGGENSPSAPPPATATTAAATAPPENLRCPRCDSSNTKFCYYNNYNLTQPRHFCKTCRRYWTKGGALRNVPIGGGCRKNKTTTAAAPTKPTATTNPNSKLIKTTSFEALSSNPLFFPSSQNPSHFLSLIRQNPIKEEYSPASLFTPSHVSSDSSFRALGLDHFNPAHLPGYRNQTLTSSVGQGIVYGEQNYTSGVQEAYQRLRSSANCYSDHATPLIVGNAGSGILESSPIGAGDQLGFWNIPALSWNADSAYP